ncbi:hypothetical protein DITRI_Ditri01bG0181600 [Diplodiscus trichospermus]
MAETAAFVSQPSQASITPPKPTSIKALSGLSSIPTNYTFLADFNDEAPSDKHESIPTIDFSLLTSTVPDERSKALQDLGKACLEWGFFKVINHGVPETMMKAIIETLKAFFELPEEEKQEFKWKHVLDPIKYGTSCNDKVDNVMFWRDYLKFLLHPEFHSPHKPPALREIALEYSKRVRHIAREIVRGICDSLGLEEDYVDKVLNWENGRQLLVANFYPPCPQPDLAMGIPPHSDNGLLTLLTQNEIGGLQVAHEGKWVNVSPIPNSFLANIGDQIEILSNGKYKSILHRGVVNNKHTRISLALTHGPDMDAIVSPASKLLEDGTNPAVYKAMKYKDYVELQYSGTLDGKSCLERIRI